MAAEKPRIAATAAGIQLVLASRSPRRAALLEQLGLHFKIVPADIAERRKKGQTPQDYALSTALAKARATAAASEPGCPVLGADTDVVLDGDILGKPRDRDHALAMLAALSDRSHIVYSAVAIVKGELELTGLCMTRVDFGPIPPAEAAAYWATGEPADKAGSYAIQGGAARWVKRIEGSYTGVVGLPLHETVMLLQQTGIACPWQSGQ